MSENFKNGQEQEEQVHNGQHEKTDDACKEQGTSEQHELTAVKDQLVRLGADFQNFKRRVEKDRSDWFRSAQSEILLELLPVIDDFDRALAEAQKEGINPEFAQWFAGFELIHKALYEFLKNRDVQPIEQMKDFDPELHEALMQVESENHESGQIVQVLQRGFMFKGTVLRPAKVSVAK